MRIVEYNRAPLTAETIQVLGVGNSHMAAEGASPAATNGWFALLAARFPGVTFTNVGIGGQRIQLMLDNITTQVYNRLHATKLNVIFAQEFGNEMANNGRDAAAAHAKWVTYCNNIRTYARNNNRRVYIITVGLHPTGAGATPSDTAARIASVKAANTLIRANYRAYCDQLIDLGAHEPFASLFNGTDFTEAAFAATGMYNRSDGVPNDRVHLGNAGHARLAEIGWEAIRRVRVVR